MTFENAKKELKKIAEKKYHCIQYTLMVYGDREKKSECGVYVEGYNWHHGDCWKEAFEALQAEITGENNIKESINLEEQPGEEQ
jgi:hypothetical protein